MDSYIATTLNNNPGKNIATLGYFNNYPVVAYYTEKNSTLILGKSDEVWAHLASSSESELSELLHNHHKRTKYYHSVEDWMIPLILKHGEADWMFTTNRYVLNLNVHIDSPVSKIRPGLSPFCAAVDRYPMSHRGPFHAWPTLDRETSATGLPPRKHRLLESIASNI